MRQLIFHVSCPTPSLRSFWMRYWVFSKFILEQPKGEFSEMVATFENIIQANFNVTLSKNYHSCVDKQIN